MKKPTPIVELGAYDEESGDLNVVIDTPKGSRNKFKYDETHGVFKLAHVLPAGAVFPFDFGDIPGTLAEDGDPVDVVVLMDEPAFAGCLVPSRLVGVIVAEQTQEGKTVRNDRLIAVAAESRNHRDVRSLDDVGASLVDEIEHFFVSYNAARGKEFKPLRRGGPEDAEALVRDGIERFEEK
jgi:inorganic pyrophosphatase